MIPNYNSRVASVCLYFLLLDGYWILAKESKPITMSPQRKLSKKAHRLCIKDMHCPQNSNTTEHIELLGKLSHIL